MGYDSLFSYLTKKLSYSESSAYRRMQAARVLRQIPEIKSQLESGSLKLSQVCLVQKTLRQEEKVSREKISLQKRKEIFAQVADKTGVETEKILDAQVSVELMNVKPQERHKRDDSVELNLRVSKALYAKLQKVKELYSHIEPGADWLKILELMADDVIQKRDPLAKKPATRHFAKTQMQKQKPGRRVPIPSEIKRQVLRRDEGKCQYTGDDGRKCEGRHQPQLDHIEPVHRGGRNAPQNLRVLCRKHNVFRFRQERFEARSEENS